VKSKLSPEFDEGPQATTRFKVTMQKILSVPRSEIQKREAEYQKRVALNPRKRGPKRKIKPSVAHVPVDDA
jgi:hypothetical protein